MSRRSRPKPHESMRPWVPAPQVPATLPPPDVRQRLQVLRAFLSAGPVSAWIPPVFRL